MAAQILSALCCLLALIQNAAGSLVLDVNPPEIYPGLTQSLTVNCSFSFDGVADIVGLISLIIAKENQQGQFDDLLSANIFTPDDIKGVDQLNGMSSVTGHISGDGQSFLAIQWSMPISSEAGRYLCEVNGVNDDGHPTEKSQTINVTSKKPDFDQLTSKVSDLQHQLDLQEALNRNQSQAINTLLSLTQTQSNMITTLLNTTADLKEKLEIQNVLLPFHLSTEYKGHYYLVSKLDWENSFVAEETCKAYGGHLVEINDSDEQRYVGEFLDSLHNFNLVLISGTQEYHPGTWTYTQYGGGNLTYTNWYPGYPQDNFCIHMFRSGWRWRDHPCAHSGGQNYRFMCEVNIK